jgi:hypothetical protein
MATEYISDFKHGLDVRKGPLTAIGGSLQIFENAVITNGGEIEKRMAFVYQATLPAGCFSLFSAGGMLHTFGTGAAPALPILPVPIVYHQLADAGSPIARLTDIEVYKGLFWVGAYLQNGALVNWWNGAIRANPGDYSRVYRSKMYRTAGPLLRFSSVDNPGTDDNTVASPGGGFIDVSANDAESDGTSGLEIYYSQLAVFSRHATQLWDVDPDPALNTLKQVLRVGTVAPRSVYQFGSGDVLFLADTGVRSLRALNLTLAAGVIDVGSPIDFLVQADLRTNFYQASQAQAIVNPISSRYWLAVGQSIYSLSFFPSAKISAWSKFTVPFIVTRWAVVQHQVYCLDTNNNVYLYGGVNGSTFDASVARIRTPHSGMERPVVMKKVTALAAIATGDWTMKLGMVADNTELFETVANFTGPTVSQHRIPAAGHGTHVALEFSTTGSGPATLGAVSIDYGMNEKL